MPFSLPLWSLFKMSVLYLVGTNVSFPTNCTALGLVENPDFGGTSSVLSYMLRTPQICLCQPPPMHTQLISPQTYYQPQQLNKNSTSEGRENTHRERLLPHQWACSAVWSTAVPCICEKSLLYCCVTGIYLRK